MVLVVNGTFRVRVVVIKQGLCLGCFSGEEAALKCGLARNKDPKALRVQSTPYWGIHGFYTRNRRIGFGNMLCIWVLGPLGGVQSVG